MHIRFCCGKLSVVVHAGCCLAIAAVHVLERSCCGAQHDKQTLQALLVSMLTLLVLHGCFHSSWASIRILQSTWTSTCSVAAHVMATVRSVVVDVYVRMCDAHIEFERVVFVELMQAFFPSMFAAKSQLVYLYLVTVADDPGQRHSCMHAKFYEKKRCNKNCAEHQAICMLDPDAVIKRYIAAGNINVLQRCRNKRNVLNVSACFLPFSCQILLPGSCNPVFLADLHRRLNCCFARCFRVLQIGRNSGGGRSTRVLVLMV